MLLSDTIDIDAPPDVVWSVWRDVEHWPDWTQSVSRVELLERGPLRLGLRARVHQPKLPIAVWTVTSVDEPAASGRAGFTWVSTSPGAHVTGSHRIEANGRGSRVVLSVDFQGPIGRLVGWLARDLSKRYLRFEATGLKARSEAQTTAGLRSP